MLGLGFALAGGAVSRAGVSPSLDLNFLSGTMPAGVTFTRSGAAWSYNSAGVLTSRATNVPRLGYDPVTLAPRGLLVEEARTNLAPGQMTGGTYWSSVGSGFSLASGAAAPDGTTAGVTLTEGGSASSYGINLITAVAITASSPVSASIFVKAGTCTWLRLMLADTSTASVAAQAWFNVSAGTAGTVNSFTGGATSISSTIASVGGGWMRCTITATLAAATTAAILVRMVSGDAITNDTGGGKTLVVWAPQLEVGGFASSPILTTTAAATRNADVTAITSLSPWFNPNEGTLMVEASRYALRSGTAFVTLSDGTTANTLQIVNGNATPAQQRADVVTGSVNQAQLVFTANGVENTVYKEALAYKANDFAGCGNGGSVLTDSSGSVPTVDRMAIGTNVGPTVFLAGYIRRIRYWRVRRPNADLQAITS